MGRPSPSPAARALPPGLALLGASLIGVSLVGCNPDPGEPAEQVGYRAGTADATSGERGTVKITEVLWTGSSTGPGLRDRGDVFIELRNEGAMPVNVRRWFLVIEGAMQRGWSIPDTDLVIEVGQHIFIAAKSTGCFPEPDLVMPELAFPDGDPFELTLMDADERLIEPIGDTEMPPLAGTWDTVRVRSMERIELMFGGQGTDPQAWHHYTAAAVDIPNNDRVAEGPCRDYTLASPGRPNSPDYSGAFAAGNLE